jgi:hypothetical protein
MSNFTPTTDACVLSCRLRECVITDEGDFIPAGTPVKVMGWKGNGSTDTEPTAARRREMVKRPKITVRASAYMYSQSFDYEDGGRSAVGIGLFIDVDPQNLTFDDVHTF